MKNERGQAMVILAFALVALAAFAGLAIDGGRLFSARRLAQNTADAAAMTGARLLADLVTDCTPGDIGAANNTIASAMESIINDNGIDAASGDDASMGAWYVDASEARIGALVWNGTVPIGATGIEVNLALTDTTTFLRIVGQSYINVAADATAMAGPVQYLTGGGVLPLGVWDGVIADLSEGDEFTIFDDEDYCRGLPCDFSGHHVPGSLHGWLNMSHVYNVDLWHEDLDRTFSGDVGNDLCAYNADGSVNAADTGLQGWADIDCRYPYPIFAGARGALNGDYIHAVGGIRNTTVAQIDEDYDEGDLVYAPIFDYIYVPDNMETVFGEGAPVDKTPDVGWIRGSGGENSSYLHIIGFVGMLLSDINVQGANSYITVNFAHAIIGEGVITPSSGFGSGVCTELNVWSVQLWE